MTESVQSALRRTATGTASTGPTRVRGVIVRTGATGGGRLTVIDGAAGPTRIDFDTGEANSTIPIYFPDRGVKFDGGINVTTLTNITVVTFITG